jgi:CGNR zinc finger protein
VGPQQFPRLPWPGQAQCLCRHRPHGCRRCLLKGCERWFRPPQPRCHYCSVVCQQAARRWRRWRASQRYRASQHGQERRRQQSQRYRERQRQRQLTAASEEPPCEGQRAAAAGEDSGDSGQRPCDRPGCYQLFVPTSRSPHQHFCSCGCRQALRRVRQRELRHRQRRRRGSRPRRCQPPDSS